MTGPSLKVDSRRLAPADRDLAAGRPRRLSRTSGAPCPAGGARGRPWPRRQLSAVSCLPARPSLGRRAPRAGDPPGARDARPVRPEGPGRARRAALARSRPLGGPPPAGSRAGRARVPRPTPSCRPRARACTRSRSGPVHAGIIEPGHFRFTANGETVVRLEERLGYAHRGLEGLMTRRPAGARPRSSPAAPAATPPSPTPLPSPAPSRRRSGARRRPRAHWLRALMAELERLANHLGDIGAICNDAAFALMHAHSACCANRCCAPPTPPSATG